MLPTLIPQEDEDAAKELAEGVQEARDRAPPRQAVHAGRRPRHAPRRPLRRGRDGRGRPDARLRRSRGRSSTGSGSRRRASQFDRNGIATDDHRRTNVPHIYAAGDVAGYWQLAHTGVPRGRGRGRERDGARGRDRRARRAAADLHRSGDRRRRAHRGAGERAATATTTSPSGGRPWAAIARAVMSGDTTGWVKTIHETTYGELLGLVIVGPHATDLIGEASSRSTPSRRSRRSPTASRRTRRFSEAIKEAGLVALGRAIHLPPRRRRYGSARRSMLDRQCRSSCGPRLVVRPAPEVRRRAARRARGTSARALAAQSRACRACSERSCSSGCSAAALRRGGGCSRAGAGRRRCRSRTRPSAPARRSSRLRRTAAA